MQHMMISGEPLFKVPKFHFDNVHYRGHCCGATLLEAILVLSTKLRVVQAMRNVGLSVTCLFRCAHVDEDLLSRLFVSCFSYKARLWNDKLNTLAIHLLRPAFLLQLTQIHLLLCSCLQVTLCSQVSGLLRTTSLCKPQGFEWHQ